MVRWAPILHVPNLVCVEAATWKGPGASKKKNVSGNNVVIWTVMCMEGLPNRDMLPPPPPCGCGRGCGGISFVLWLRGCGFSWETLHAYLREPGSTAGLYCTNLFSQMARTTVKVWKDVAGKPKAQWTQGEFSTTVNLLQTGANPTVRLVGGNSTQSPESWRSGIPGSIGMSKKRNVTDCGMPRKPCWLLCQRFFANKCVSFWYHVWKMFHSVPCQHQWPDSSQCSVPSF